MFGSSGQRGSERCGSPEISLGPARGDVARGVREPGDVAEILDGLTFQTGDGRVRARAPGFVATKRSAASRADGCGTEHIPMMIDKSPVPTLKHLSGV